MALPSTYKSLVIQQLSTNFREAVHEVTLPMPKPGPDEVVLKNRYVGVNATDVNISAGRYGTGVGAGLGLEGIGEVVLTGANVTNFKIGDSVVYFGAMGAYSEYVTIKTALLAVPVPDIRPEYVSLLCSGLTASLGLEKAGEIKKGEKVLITAAAGALGQIAVQLCKAEGCHVIGLTSSTEKAKILKDLGCDDIINYKEEDLEKVLSEKYPEGIDVIWETIGGTVFDALFKQLARLGRLVVVGYISAYVNQKHAPPIATNNIPSQLLWKSATIRGFLVSSYPADIENHFKRLLTSYQAGKLKLNLDNGSGTDGGMFKGLEGCIRGVEHLHTGKSTGKVLVEIQ